MNKKITIEYCTAWGYIDRAVALAKNILDEHKNNVEMVSLITSGGGVFEVKIGDELLFSKKELGRFPESDEAEKLIREKL